MNRKIKAMLVEKGITQTSIAKKIKVNRVTVSVVIGGFGKSKRVREAIANALGLSVEELWDEAEERVA